jgi:hypothetical protein
MSEKQPKDFELQAKIPGVGELSLKLYQNTWTGLIKFIQQQWPWVMATIVSGTIGAHVVGQSNQPIQNLPRGEVPAQIK